MNLQGSNMLKTTLIFGIMLWMKMVYNNLKVFRRWLGKISIRQNVTTENDLENSACV